MSFSFSSERGPARLGVKHNTVLLHATCYAYKTVTRTEQGSFSKGSDLGKLTEKNQTAAQTLS